MHTDLDALTEPDNNLEGEVALALIGQEIKAIREGQQETAETLKEVVQFIHENSKNQVRIEKQAADIQALRVSFASLKTELRTWGVAGGVLLTLVNLSIGLIALL